MTHLMLLIFTALPAPDVLFEEHWDSGAINPAVWRAVSAADTTLAVEDLNGDGSDYALAMWIGPNTRHWAVSMRGVQSFLRADAPVARALIWGDPKRGAGDYVYPAGMAWLFGFHHEKDMKTGAIYEDQEAVLDNWFAPMYGDMNKRFQFTQSPAQSVFTSGAGGKNLSPAFTEALSKAVSKATAIQVRISLDQKQGARFEWYHPVLRVWVTEADSMGISGGRNESLTLGFGPAAACVFIDDIVVERGTTTPPRPATSAPPGTVLFEDWETGAIDPARWSTRKDSMDSLLQVVDLHGDGSDHALAMWNGPKAIHWPIAVRSVLGFKRGSSPRMTALLWGDPSRTDGKYTYPDGMGWLAGFHNEPGAKPWIFDDLEAVLDDWIAAEYGNTNLRFTQPPAKSLFARGEGGPRLPDNFTAALREATSKDKAIQIRIALGEKQGAMLEWRRPGEANWVVEADTRGVSGGAAEDVCIGFGPASACVFVDDIAVTGTVSEAFDGIPLDYPRFRFEGDEQASRLLSNFYWYHFANRVVSGGYGRTMFNKEYISISDLWANGAKDGPERKPMQQSFRESLLGVAQDDNGYIHTHQHFSHAHEAGWPFPLWTQVPDGPTGVTIGWHFNTSGPGWAMADLRRLNLTQYFGEGAMQDWGLDNVESQGLVDGRWSLRATGPSPLLTPPMEAGIDAFNCPFLQLRASRTPIAPEGARGWVEWMRDGDAGFSPERRVVFAWGQGGNPEYEATTGVPHTLIEMYTHPQWKGRIKAIRLSLAPGEKDVEFKVDSFFTVYDTRHAMNNPLFILASWNYIRWTGDVDFLRENIVRMRKALVFLRDAMGGGELGFIRNPWVGHDGRPGFDPGPPKVFHNGRGIGDQYCDILPFGGDAAESTMQYYAATRAMSGVEEAVLAHPEWGLPPADAAFASEALNTHAEIVRAVANKKFWNKDAGRFVASIDADGVAHDYGYTMMNQEAIWYGFASDENARSIMDWISGRRIVEGDTSTGEDIYHWRFAPRLSTRRNVDWYSFVWSAPETIPWGFQVQDGGAVLGFSFQDMWSRLQVYGPDDAWLRLRAILDWEKEVWREGGYRNYYSNHEGTMQGGGPPGGLGIDQEFLETSMVPAIVPLGFMGLDPGVNSLVIAPRMPEACPEMTVTNLLYHGARMDITASNVRARIVLHDVPAGGVRIKMSPEWSGPVEALLERAGEYVFERR